jgi:hypothetical protein
MPLFNFKTIRFAGFPDLTNFLYAVKMLQLTTYSAPKRKEYGHKTQPGLEIKIDELTMNR